jgi:hypothetical protein
VGNIKIDLREPFVMMGDRWNWFRIVSMGGPWYL